MAENFTENRRAFLGLPKPKAVIFDWDNTLVDTWPLIQAAIDKTMHEMGREPWGLDKVRDTVHKSMRESFPGIFGNEWEKAGEIYKKNYRSIHLQIQFLPGAFELVNTLEKQGVMQFIVSNKMGPTLRQEVEKLAVSSKFFSIIGAQDASFDKPSKDPVDLALMGSDLDPIKDEIWFIGDTIADVECAYNSNCRPVIYGHSSNQISKTISAEILAEDRFGNGLTPVYFEHDELVRQAQSW